MIAAVANHLWQSTLFAVVAGLLVLALRKNRAQVRYSLWLAASLKFLIPFSVFVAAGTHLTPVVSAPMARSVLPGAVQEIGKTFVVPPVLVSSPESGNTSLIPAVLFGVWLCGFAAVLLRWSRNWLHIRASVRRGTAAGVLGPVRIVSSPALLEPGIFGILRPVLLLPEGITRQLSPAHLEAILAHELCHARRRDNLAAALHMLVEALFWFHPLVWWIGARLVEERERACDEEVIRQGNQPDVYAESILKTCQFYVESPLACVSGITGSDLRRRIESILSNRLSQSLTAPQKALLWAAGAAAVILPLAIGVATSRPHLASVSPQTSSAANPKFEVASIKPCKVEGGMEIRLGHVSPGRLDTGCDFLADENNLGLIQRAYIKYAGGHRNPFRIVPIEGGPKWVRSQGYKIDAATDGNPSVEMTQGPMLQALLEDRFKLKIHRGATDGPVYALTVVKNGPKLTHFQEGSCIKVDSVPKGPPPSGQRYCDDMISARNPASIDAEGVTLAEFCQLLDLVMDRPVVDDTGITGKFNIHFSFAHDESTSQLPPFMDAAGGLSEPNAPSIFEAVRESLGLKLVAAKGRVDALVIDSVGKPSEN